MKSPFARIRPVGPSSFQDAHIDVLSEIFVQSLPYLQNAEQITPPTRSHAPLNVLQVCRSWRYCAFNTPTIWSRIYFSSKHTPEKQEALLDYITFALQNSKGSALDIHLRVMSSEINMWLLKISDMNIVSNTCVLLEKILVSERSRWRMVHLSLPVQLIPIQSFTQDEVSSNGTIEAPPGLEYFSSVFHCEALAIANDVPLLKSDTDIALDISHCERLSELELKSPVLGLASNRTSHFTKFTSIFLENEIRLTPSQFISLLSVTPNLEELRGCFPYETHPDAVWNDTSIPIIPPSPRLIYLPRLTSLSLTEKSRNSFATEYDAAVFLSHLVFPSLSKFILYTSWLFPDAATLLGRELRGLMQRSAPPLKKFVLFGRISVDMLIETLRLVPSLEHLELDKTAMLCDIVVCKMAVKDPGDYCTRESNNNGNIPLCPNLKSLIAYARFVENLDTWAQMISSRAISNAHEDDMFPEKCTCRTLERVELRAVPDHMKGGMLCIKRAWKGQGFIFRYS